MERRVHRETRVVPVHWHWTGPVELWHLQQKHTRSLQLGILPLILISDLLTRDL